MGRDDERDQAQRERGSGDGGQQETACFGYAGPLDWRKRLVQLWQAQSGLAFYCVHPAMTTAYWTVASIVYYCRLLPLLRVISPDEITRGGVWYAARNNNCDRMLMQFDPEWEEFLVASFPCKRLDLRIKQEKMLSTLPRCTASKVSKGLTVWLSYILSCLIFPCATMLCLCYVSVHLDSQFFSMFMTDWGRHHQTHPEIAWWGQKIWGALKPW